MRPDHLFSGFLSLALFLALPANASEGIDIVGSSTVYPFSTVAAERFAQITGGRSPKVESTGSGGGLALFCAGYGEKTPDITNASRRIKKSEQKLCAENGVSKVLEVKIGYDGIVIAQSIQGAAFALTRRELFLALGRDIPGPDGFLQPNQIKNGVMLIRLFRYRHSCLRAAADFRHPRRLRRIGVRKRLRPVFAAEIVEKIRQKEI